MGQTYKAIGINLKSMPLGEADKILTILTREHGLIRAVAPGARKANAKLGGRSELFVINDLLLSKGRSLDRLSQAESIESYPRLSRDLAKLAVSQYWAETVLYQTPDRDPNAPLFDLLCQRLTHLAESEPGLPVLIHLVCGIMQFLSLAGVAPQVDCCCLTGQPATPQDMVEGSRVIFSPAAGGVVVSTPEGTTTAQYNTEVFSSKRLRAQAVSWAQDAHTKSRPVLPRSRPITLSAAELRLMQQLTLDDDLMTPPVLAQSGYAEVEPWLQVEKALRAYLQYQTERPIRSAALIEGCFSQTTVSSPAVSASHP